jgi:hypothetical protein
MTDRNRKILKVGLVWATLLFFVRVYAQKGGYKGLSITNKSPDLQTLFGLLQKYEFDKWATTSGYLEPKGYIRIEYPTPFGNIIQTFYDDNTYNLKKYDGNEYVGEWSVDGSINISGLGIYNEGDIGITAMAINTLMI